MHTLIQTVFAGGERFPLLIDEVGVPDFWATLFTSQQLRDQTQTSITSCLNSIEHFYKWEKINNRDIIQDFQNSLIPGSKFVESITRYTVCVTLMNVHPRGFYAWKNAPQSNRQREDERMTGLIKQFWLESGGVYGYRKITQDLRDIGERCGKHRIYRLMKQEGLRSQTGYRRRRGGRYSRPSIAVPNHVAQQFDVIEPNKVWVTDITYNLVVSTDAEQIICEVLEGKILCWERVKK